MTMSPGSNLSKGFLTNERRTTGTTTYQTYAGEAIKQRFPDGKQINTMKLFKVIKRHYAQVVDERGNVLDWAHGRNEIHAMRKRHGLQDIATPTNAGTDNLPTGFEESPTPNT